MPPPQSATAAESVPSRVDRSDLVARSWHRRVVDRSLGKAAQRSIDRGADLVLAAAALVESAGGDSFGVQDVADAAGVSLRTLYVHFESKDDLLLAVYEESEDAFARTVEGAIARYDDPLDRLAGAIYLASRLWERSPRKLNLGIVRLRSKLTDAFPDAVQAAQAPVTDLFAGLVAAAADQGRIRARSLEAATSMLVTLIHSLGRSHALGEADSAGVPGALDLLDFAIEGLRATPDETWPARFLQMWADLPPARTATPDL